MSLKKCPKCAEKVKWDAKVCKHCSYEFTAEELEKARKEHRTGNVGAWIVVGIVAIALARCVSTESDFTASTVKDSNHQISEVNIYSETGHGNVKVDLDAGRGEADVPLRAAMVLEQAGKAIKAGATDIPAGIQTITFWFTHPVIDQYGKKDRTKILALKIKTEDLQKIEYSNISYASLLDFGDEYDFSGPLGRRAAIQFCQDDDNRRDALRFCVAALR